MNQLNPDDLEELRKLIELNGLDASDLENCDLKYFVGVKRQGILVAVGGLDVLDESALLRSIATLPEHRGKGLALKIVRRLEELAISSGVPNVYLLTETASSFFAKLEYQTAERSTAPDEIKATAQFSSLCPGSAILMNKKIANQ